MNGLIVPAGSPLRQFEVQQIPFPCKKADAILPWVMWVTPQIPKASYLACVKCKTVHRVRDEDAIEFCEAVGLPYQKPGPAYHIYVCDCLGRFIE